MNSSEQYLQRFYQYIRIEKSLSPRTVDAYMRDIHKFNDFLEGKKSLDQVTLEDLQEFMAYLYDEKIQARS